ncbi:hypothetical protein GW17_00038934 [Ensete ventricosum]|nr:hypothetical protein GW17_00038934 [Ensete ventricosum]
MRAVAARGHARGRFFSRAGRRLPAGRLRAACGHGHGRFFSRVRRRSVSPRRETDRGDVTPFSFSFLIF